MKINNFQIIGDVINKCKKKIIKTLRIIYHSIRLLILIKLSHHEIF